MTLKTAPNATAIISKPWGYKAMAATSAPLILGIDTSCDDTGIGISRGATVLANIVASQSDLHAQYGGVMPEQASRAHLNIIDEVLEQALQQAAITLEDIDAIAVTHGPGLVGALLVGLNYGKALAWALDKIFIPIHHLEGHIAASVLNSDCEPPFLCLIASGGHTSLIEVQAWGKYRALGQSRDDAAGEAFDKVARLLGLPYPGGAALANLADTGNADFHRFTMPLQRQQGFEFSFSGLKTSVRTLIQKQPEANPADIAASFQHTVVESLYRTSLRAAKATGHQRVVIAGGVAANRALRQRFQEGELEPFFPSLELSTDNGTMIALAAAKRWQAGLIPTTSQQTNPETIWEQDATPYLPLAS